MTRLVVVKMNMQKKWTKKRLPNGKRFEYKSISRFDLRRKPQKQFHWYLCGVG